MNRLAIILFLMIFSHSTYAASQCMPELLFRKMAALQNDINKNIDKPYGSTPDFSNGWINSLISMTFPARAVVEQCSCSAAALAATEFEDQLIKSATQTAAEKIEFLRTLDKKSNAVLNKINECNNPT